jgi:hypothetical protein|tara:strand:- start:927 stop:1505 length:579 start_codon:yes stop_codon:yes gene_type:complete
MIFKYKFCQNLSFVEIFFKYLPIFVLFLLLTNCGVPNWAKPSKVDSRSQPVNAKEKARKNINEGRGISIGGALKGRRGGTTYEFSTSNSLWRASLELIDFIPLSTVDYSGGIIITDWYSDSADSSESVKITIRFLSNEIQSNSLKIIVHNKKCKTNENCNINEINSKIKQELRRSIITKAAQFERDSKKSKK